MAHLLEGMEDFYMVLTAWNNMVPPNATSRNGVAVVTLEKGWRFIFVAEIEAFAIQPVDPSGNRKKILTLQRDEEDKLKTALRLLNV